MYHLAFLRGDTKQMAQLLQEAAGKEDERVLLSAQADTEAYYGRLNRARYFSRRAAESELRTESGLPAVLEQGRRQVCAKPSSEIRCLLNEESLLPMASPPTWQVRPLAALALARIGDTGRAQVLVEEMEKDNPSNTRLNVYWLPTIKAAIEMKHGHRYGAITVLESKHFLTN